ncbi:MAG: O-antigen ligase family protein [Bacilli bacterium]|nr:O-antigen ligase family protein [Bacilli bacterium]
MDKIKKNILPIYIIINILYLLIGSFFAYIGSIQRVYFSYGYIFVLLPLNIIMAILLRKRYKKNIIHIFLLSILVFSIISTIFAYKKDIALFGEFNRYEGLFMIAYYLSIVYLSSLVEEKKKKMIAYVIIGVVALEILFGLFQKFNIFNVPVYYHNGEIFFSGFPSNPNFMATLILIGLCYLIGLFFESKKNIIYILLILYFLTGLMMTNTLSCIVGLFFVLIYLIVYSIKFKTYKKLIILLLCIISVFCVLHNTKMTTLAEDLKLFKKQTTKMVTGDYESDYNFGSGRIYVWRNTMNYLPKYLLTGIGIDNFKYINNGLPIYRYGFPYDKAHNEYLQILVTAGIYTLLSYLALYFVITFRGIKNSFKNKELYLILPVIGYLVQAFFNISVIEVAPLFYITLGLNIKRS